MTLFYDPCGPLICYKAGVLKIEDLNPQVSTHWRMSRWEMVRFSLRGLLAALRV